MNQDKITIDKFLTDYFAQVLALRETYPEANQILTVLLELRNLDTEPVVRAAGSDLILEVAKLVQRNDFDPQLAIGMAKLIEIVVQLLVTKISIDKMQAPVTEPRILH